MDGLVKTTEKREVEEEFSFRKLFIPLTTLKAIHWIVLVGVMVYAIMLFNPAVWDDNEYLLNNSTLQTINIPAYFGVNIFNNSGQYRPLTVSYFGVLYAIFGSNLFFYHVIQLVLHITNAILLFLLFKIFFNKKLSLFLSLLFLVHPMQVESVSYISATDSTLFFLFGLIALLIGVTKELNFRKIVMQQILLFASILVKETGILFFLLILFYQFIFKKKYFVISLILSCISVLLYFSIRIYIGNVTLVNRPLIPITRITVAERLLTIPQVIFYYIKTFFYPVTLGINQQWVVTSPSVSTFYVPLFFDVLFFSLLCVFGYRIFKKNKKVITVYIFFSAWFLLGLGIHSQLVALDMTVADRWAYFSLAGLLGVIGVILQHHFFSFGKYQNKIVISIAVLIIFLLAARTVVRNIEWQNPINLWNGAIAVNDNFLSEDQLASAYVYADKLDKAVNPAEKSVLLFPNDNNLYNLGYIYEQLGNIQQAKKEYRLAYQAKNYIPWQHQHYLQVYEQLAILSLRTNDQKTAKDVLLAGVKDYPGTPELWYLLTICEYKLGDQKSAINAAQKALLLSPNDAQMKDMYQKLLNIQPR